MVYEKLNYGMKSIHELNIKLGIKMRCPKDRSVCTRMRLGRGTSIVINNVLATAEVDEPGTR